MIETYQSWIEVVFLLMIFFIVVCACVIFFITALTLVQEYKEKKRNNSVKPNPDISKRQQKIISELAGVDTDKDSEEDVVTIKDAHK